MGLMPRVDMTSIFEKSRDNVRCTSRNMSPCPLPMLQELGQI